MKDNGKAHQVISKAYAQNPELFPPEMQLGYSMAKPEQEICDLI